jgi:hypothetical protein
VFSFTGHRIPPIVLLIIAFGLCLRMVYFSQEIGGSHTFRQAMVANQIDTLKSGPYPGPKLGFLERYDQAYDYGVVFYDTPIYQYIAAKVSDLFNVDAVKAARLVNLAAYVGESLVLCGILMEIGLGIAVAGLTLFLFAISPLSIQHTLGVYPDTLAVLAAYASFYALLRYERQRSWQYFLVAAFFGATSTLIKLSIYLMFGLAYAWNLLWSSRWRIFLRIDAIVLGVLMLASVAAFPLVRSYVNYSQSASAANLDESFRLDWFIGPLSERFEFFPWHEIGARFTFEYLFPLLMPFATVGLWRVIRGFCRKPDDPQRSLLGLVIGGLAMMLIFFNVFFRHDYYAMPLTPIYCVLTSIGLLYTWSAYGMQFGRQPKLYAVLALAATGILLNYAYSLRLLNYNENEASRMIGKNLQDLVPDAGYVFYFQFVESTNPEFLYYARRRGAASHIDNANNEYVSNIVKTHHWNPDEVYLVVVGARYKPDTLSALKQRLGRYNLREIGTAYEKSVVYKLVPKG